MSNSQEIKERIKSVMISDRSRNVESVLRVLRSDLYTLLSDYFSLQADDLKVGLSQCEGGYCLTVQAVTDRILDSGNIIE